MATKPNIVIEPEIEDIPFTENTKEDVVIYSPKTPSVLEEIIEEELPWYTEEKTSYIIERKTDTQLITPESEVILNRETKHDTFIPPLSFLSSGSVEEYNPIEQEIGANFKLKHLISYDYTNPLYYKVNNYPGKDKDYNGELIVKNLKDLIENCIDKIIEKYPKLTLISGYRCLDLNRMIGGSHDNNSHIKGCAVDFKVPGEYTSYVFNWCIENLDEWYELMWAYPERGNKSWIHISYKKGLNLNVTTLASER